MFIRLIAATGLLHGSPFLFPRSLDMIGKALKMKTKTKTNQIGKSKSNITSKTTRLVILCMLCAIGYVCTLVLRIEVPPFLTYEPKDAIITFAGLIYGPLSSLVLSVLLPLLEMVISRTGIYGMIMNFIAAAAFSCTVSLIYKSKKNQKSLLVGVFAGSAVLLGVMMLANLLITPYFMGASVSDVKAMIPTLLLPFNAAKGILNSAIVILLHSYVLTALKKAGLVYNTEGSTLPEADTDKTAAKSKVLKYTIATVIATVLAVVAFVLIFVLLKGNLK